MLFHPLKHHLLWIRSFISEYALRGEAVMPEVATKLMTAGNSQMDVYTGALLPKAIAGAIVQHLSEHNLLEPGVYADWLQTTGGYRLVNLPDQSEWVLRQGEIPGSHVHIHPARYSPYSTRVKAGTLKSAIMVCIWQLLHPHKRWQLSEINHLRQTWLLLPPIRSVDEAEGLRRILDQLASKEN